MKGLDGLANCHVFFFFFFFWGGGGCLLTTGAVGLTMVWCLFFFLGNNCLVHVEKFVLCKSFG